MLVLWHSYEVATAILAAATTAIAATSQPHLLLHHHNHIYCCDIDISRFHSYCYLVPIATSIITATGFSGTAMTRSATTATVIIAA
jgi:hypothetical protein